MKKTEKEYWEPYKDELLKIEYKLTPYCSICELLVPEEWCKWCAKKNFNNASNKMTKTLFYIFAKQCGVPMISLKPAIKKELSIWKAKKQ